MSFRRFLFIRQRLKFAEHNGANRGASRMWKVAPVADTLRRSFNALMQFPNECLSVDEGVIPFRGHKGAV
jgi:hypothetical protein